MCRFSCADSLFSVKTRLLVSRFEIESGRRVETATAAWRSLVHDGLIDGRFTVLLVVVCGVLARKLKHACVSKRLSLVFFRVLFFSLFCFLKFKAGRGVGGGCRGSWISGWGTSFSVCVTAINIVLLTEVSFIKKKSARFCSVFKIQCVSLCREWEEDTRHLSEPETPPPHLLSLSLSLSHTHTHTHTQSDASHCHTGNVLLFSFHSCWCRAFQVSLQFV